MPIETSSKSRCGWCNDNNHDSCAVGTKHRGKHSKFKNGIVWICSCDCNIGRRKCAHCNNRVTEEIDPDTWECRDVEACRALVNEKRAKDPFLNQLREIKESVNMAKVEENKQKAEKVQAEKAPTFCLVTGEPTKGGLFKPGMDARYVSLRVKEVEEAGFTAKATDAARSKMKKDGVSDTLIAKFEKSAGLAKERAERRAADKQAKADAKAAKAAAAETAEV